MELIGEFVDYIQDFNDVSIIIRLVLQALFGGLIGLEREAKRHSAGFRTFTLVCLGSALGTIANIYLNMYAGGADTSRIAAGVVSGIGFLGAGTIILTPKNRVKGLTTAACLWTAGCLGIAIGSGMIVVGTFAFILIMVTMSILAKLSTYVHAHNRIITLYIEVEKEDVLDALIEFMHSKEYKILTLEKRKDKVSKGHFSVTMEIDLKKEMLHTDVVHELGKLDGVFYIEE